MFARALNEFMLRPWPYIDGLYRRECSNDARYQRGWQLFGACLPWFPLMLGALRGASSHG